MKKISLLCTAVLVFALLLGVGIQSAQADAILFPYLSTEAGVYSFVTVSNAGIVDTVGITGYHFSYGHKSVPIDNDADCSHYDYNVVTTPADMMTFEVGGKVADAGNWVLFENAGLDTSVIPGVVPPLPVDDQIAFLIVEPQCGGVAIPCPSPANGFMYLYGWAEVIDTVNNMSLAYSTRDFNVDTTFDPDLGPISALAGGSPVILSWYPTTYVSTSWHVLPLGLRSDMTPLGGGGISTSFASSYWGGALDRDEQVWSGQRTPSVTCFGMYERDDIIGAGALASTEAGGWTGVVSPNPEMLIHRLQTATAAAGVGVRTAVNREPDGTTAP